MIENVVDDKGGVGEDSVRRLKYFKEMWRVDWCIVSLGGDG